MDEQLIQFEQLAASEFAAQRFAAAALYLEKLLALAPHHTAAMLNLGLCRQRMGDTAAAIKLFQQVCEMSANTVQARCYLGDALREAGQPQSAAEALLTALRIAPLEAEPHACYGVFLQQYGLVDEAISHLRQALAIAPGNADVWCNFGLALQTAGDISAALIAYRQALRLNATHLPAASNLLMCMQYDYFATAAHFRSAAKAWGNMTQQQALRLRKPSPHRRPGRLRVGYVSADFSQHPVGWFFLPVISGHDLSRIETFCYANQSAKDDLTLRIIAATEHWREVAALDDTSLWQLIVADEIDVLIDLSGHTAGHRLPVFAAQPAAVQFSWLGYFAGIGLSQMDAMIFGDQQLGQQGELFFSETVERLPRCHFCYSPPAYAPPPKLREQNAPLVFGSFSNIAKINEQVISLWADVLQAVPGSRLVLKWKSLGNEQSVQQLLNRFKAYGCTTEQLEFRGASSHADMLAEYGDIDIVLDPFPFSGALTTCEALWMGLPVVTLLWQRPVARQTLSILSCLHLEEFIAQTASDYIAICCRLAADPIKRRQLRTTLRDSMQTSALMNGRDLATHLETVYFRYAYTKGVLTASD